MPLRSMSGCSSQQYFGRWAPQVAAAAHIGPTDHVLDAACGTGVLARTAAERVSTGKVVGLDRNAGMLAVARRIQPAIDWHEGAAEQLPFTNASFDAVVCQFALMYFTERRAALAEMVRRVTPSAPPAVGAPARVPLTEAGLRGSSTALPAGVALSRSGIDDTVHDILAAEAVVGLDFDCLGLVRGRRCSPHSGACSASRRMGARHKRTGRARRHHRSIT